MEGSESKMLLLAVLRFLQETGDARKTEKLIEDMLAAGAARAPKPRLLEAKEPAFARREPRDEYAPRAKWNAGAKWDAGAKVDGEPHARRAPRDEREPGRPAGKWAGKWSQGGSEPGRKAGPNREAGGFPNDGRKPHRGKKY